jgi:uncharacterized LabA/DUF88 family protein
MRNYTYVDNSNFYIEGCRVSAVAKGLTKNIIEAMNNGVLDYGWQPDYGKLHEFLCGNNKAEIGAARLWGSPPPGDNFWEMVKRKGFDFKIYKRGASGQEKKVDVGIAHAMTKDAYTIIDKSDSEICLVAGDKDFVPVVEDLVGEGFKVYVVFWGQAAKELVDLASGFTCLDPYLDHLTFKSK